MEQIELLYNKGVFALNLPESLSDKKTVIVLGLAGEKGASRIAGALHYLGVSMGENLSTDYEDLVLSRAVEQNQAEDIASFITKKNTELSVWGWKPPSGIKYVEAWHGKFRNPYYIVVFRDLLSIANPNSTSTSNDVISKMRDANLHLKSLLNFVAELKAPTLLVSYEKAIADPLNLVHNLRDFLSIINDLDIDRVIDLIKLDSEVRPKASWLAEVIDVKLDQLRHNLIPKWAMHSTAQTRPMKVMTSEDIFAINMPDISHQEKTVIVLGVARGGTSMVAGALHHLGIPMGENLSTVYEDVALSKAIEQNCVEDIASIITDRNATLLVWGWKRPSAIKHVGAWLGKFRNPYYVVVFRDLFSIANRNRISMLSDVVSNMRDANMQYELLLNFITGLSSPILLISYEKAMANPLNFVCNLRDLLGINAEVAIDTAINFIKPNPEDYLKASRITDATGIVELVDSKIISGWAMHTQDKNRPAKVIIRINNEFEFSVIANFFRQDLLDKGIHPTGKCGFMLTIPTENSLHPNDIVTVRVVGDIKDLKNSPAKVGG
ncbi:conserved hypothetical protein [Nitrosomonas nitrosa]|uniref:Uncharacterized protein n=1 Tax=Nitrosomonas nitrosa TaxID=52442 RepID=A0A8H8Z1Z2_9PROT|nr:hypothetical protein [Nitrosomonas nitrosa]CAE6518399.1 conserved hypothetical protein [Nitrosomonas nitrosa]